IPGDGGAWFLPRVVGWQRAAQMLFTGETIDAQTALDWGMVLEVCDSDTLMARARELAEQIAANPAPALRLTKKLLREARYATLDSALEQAALAQAIAHRTDEHTAALEAFFNRSR
ncbi:MAG: enoyl-CoA hydratase-related protein, partial [Myxococcota bacterium]